jgi:acyl-coenzyme A thioesterase PaaI-like protein
MASGVETETQWRTAVRLSNQRLVEAPVERQLGMSVDEMSPAGVRTRMPIPVGELAGAGGGREVATSVLADTAAGLALSAYQGHGGPTIELRLDHVAAPAERARWLIAEAAVLHEVAGAAYLAAVVCDDTGQEVARATGHFVLARGSRGVASPPLSHSSAGEPSERGGPASEMTDGLFRALAPGADPADWVLPASEWLANARYDVHGGVLLAIGQLAQRRFQEADDASAALTALRIETDYLRPVPADGGELRCRTGYVRRGRSFCTLRSELARADGQLAAVVNGLWSSAGSSIR